MYTLSTVLNETKGEIHNKLHTKLVVVSATVPQMSRWQHWRLDQLMIQVSMKLSQCLNNFVNLVGFSVYYPSKHFFLILR